MTTQEFKEEFRLQYDLQSKGGPSIDDYEISVFLTLAAKDIQLLAIGAYETDEKSRRMINPLLKTKEVLSPVKSYIDSVMFKKYIIKLPDNLACILKENVLLKNCVEFPFIVDSRLDEINTFIKNPFKRPTKRKVLRVEESAGNIAVYSKEDIDSYSFTYIENPKPIIVEDLTFGLTIDGENKKSNTIIHEMVHPKIVELAVRNAINTTRTRLAKN